MRWHSDKTQPGHPSPGGPLASGSPNSPRAVLVLPLVQFECSAPHRLTPHTVSNCPRRRQWRADGRVGAAGRASRRRLYCSFMAPHSAPRGVLSMAHTSSQTVAGGCSRSPRAVLGTRGRVDLRVHHAMPAGPAGALRPWPCAHLAALLAAWPCKDAIFARCFAQSITYGATCGWGGPRIPAGVDDCCPPVGCWLLVRS